VVIHLALALTFFNFVGATAARVVLTLYALEIGAPASAVGVIGGLLFLFPLLLSWPIGALADRVGARRLLLFASACGAVSLVLLLVGPDSQIVAVTLFDFWNNGQIGELAALGCVWTGIMTIFSVAFLLFARRYQLPVV